MVVLGACCRMSFRLGRLSITTSGSGASTVSGSDYTLPYVIVCEYDSKEIRDPQPSAGIVDSQSVKTTEVGGKRGYDGGKKVKGRKRHLLVDTEGLVVKARVHVM